MKSIFGKTNNEISTSVVTIVSTFNSLYNEGLVFPSYLQSQKFWGSPGDLKSVVDDIIGTNQEFNINDIIIFVKFFPFINSNKMPKQIAYYYKAPIPKQILKHMFSSITKLYGNNLSSVINLLDFDAKYLVALNHYMCVILGSNHFETLWSGITKKQVKYEALIYLPTNKDELDCYFKPKHDKFKLSKSTEEHLKLIITTFTMLDLAIMKQEIDKVLSSYSKNMPPVPPSLKSSLDDVWKNTIDNDGFENGIKKYAKKNFTEIQLNSEHQTVNNIVKKDGIINAIEVLEKGVNHNKMIEENEYDL